MSRFGPCRWERDVSVSVKSCRLRCKRSIDIRVERRDVNRALKWQVAVGAGRHWKMDEDGVSDPTLMSPQTTNHAYLYLVFLRKAGQQFESSVFECIWDYVKKEMRPFLCDWGFVYPDLTRHLKTFFSFNRWMKSRSGSILPFYFCSPQFGFPT